MRETLAWIALLGCVAWFAQAGLLFLHLARLRTVALLDAPEPVEWPSISAIVPARDEARAIGDAVRTRLDDGYPELQVIVVDDRSTDATGAIADELAAEHGSVVAVHIEDLPEGWLGKTHALARGIEHATGEWLLVSDADVHFAPGGLRKAMAYCEHRDLDFLALVPEFRSSFIVDVLWTVFMRVLGMAMDPAAVRDPDSKTAMGSGAFMLARKSVFDRTPGYEYLKMETADDVALGMMMKNAGGRCDFANGYGIASISIYHSLEEFFRGVEKNAGSLARAPFAAVAAGMLLAAYLEYSPFLAMASGVTWAVWLGAIAAVVATVASAAALWTNTRTLLPALFWPIGWLLMAGGVLRAAWLFSVRGGLMWRDTFHPKEEVLAGQRFRAM